MRIKRKRKNCKGQAVVEYIIIIVIVAVAALTVLGFFSDTIRKKIAGVVTSFGGEEQEVEDGSSLTVLQELDESGIDTDAGSN